MRTVFHIFIMSAVAVLPVVALAAENTKDLFHFFNLSTEALIGTNVTLAATLILAYFIFGVFKYIKSGGDAQAKQQGIAAMTHGLIALFVLVSMWAIVAMLADTFFAKPSLNPLIK